MNKINAQKTKDMVIIGLMAAIICVMGPLSIWQSISFYM